VWRVEFQLRRTALREYGVHTVPDLLRGLAGVWRDLTGNWFSLRLREDQNTSRRTVHPWWQAVQACAEKLGPMVEMKRKLLPGNLAGADLYLARGKSALLGYAACLGLGVFDQALWDFSDAVRAAWEAEDFDTAYAERVVRLGGPLESEIEGGGEDVPF
jgi:hypothetical protein